MTILVRLMDISNQLKLHQMVDDVAMCVVPPVRGRVPLLQEILNQRSLFFRQK